VQCDVTDSEAVDRAFTEVEEHQGPVEVLVSNAGITRDGLLMRMKDEDFTDVLDANLTAAYRVARRATAKMVRARSGRMIFVSSVVGLLGSAGQTNYAASKAGLVGLAPSISRELGSRHIPANVVAPGFVETDMTAELPEKRQQEILGQVPLGRYASTDEIAGGGGLLASDAAGYITGAVVPVDGGLGMGHWWGFSRARRSGSRACCGRRRSRSRPPGSRRSRAPPSSCPTSGAPCRCAS